MEDNYFGKVMRIKTLTTSQSKRNNESKAYLRVRQKENIKPFVSKFLDLCIDEPEGSLIMVHPYQQQVQHTASFVQVVRAGTVWIQVFNETKRPVKIHAGTMIAAYEVIGNEQLETVGENQVRLITEAMGPEND